MCMFKIISAVIILNTLIFHFEKVMQMSAYDPRLEELTFVVRISGCKFPHAFDSTVITKLKFKYNYVAN